MIKYTDPSVLSAVTFTTLDSLADSAAAVSSTIVANSASGANYRMSFANVQISIALQGSARTGAPTVSLLIIPEGAPGVYGDVATLRTAAWYIARMADGTPVTFPLDTATTARVMTAAKVQVPNCNFKFGVLNQTGQAFAGSGNSMLAGGMYTVDNV